MAEQRARVIKKYSNRRLYDTSESRYITLDDLTERVREGLDVQVVDAASGEDLTRATLTQILIEGRGAGRFLSVPLLRQLIRMDNDALAEFFGRHVAQTLEWYERGRGVARAIAPVNPLAMAPFAAADAFARWMASGWGAAPTASMPLSMPVGPGGAMPPSMAAGPYGAPMVPPTPLPEAPAAGSAEAASTRAELDALRDELRRLREDLSPAVHAAPARPRAQASRARKRTRG